jgi:hypothetical protein
MLAMFNRNITSDVINKRLGNNGPSNPNYYRDDEQNGDNSNDYLEIDVANSASNAMTIGIAAVLFCSIGFGTYALTSGDFQLPQLGWSSNTAFVSEADASCKQLWKEDTRNDKAINCYLKTNIARLCNSQERVHLTNLITSYRNQENTHLATLGTKALASKFQAIGDYANLGMGSIMAEVEAAKDANGNIDWNKHPGLQQKIDKAKADFESGSYRTEPELDGVEQQIAAGRAVEASTNANIVLAQGVKHLAELGYVNQSDFGWLPDRIVKAAFKNPILVASSPCNN